ncbi:MAG: alpha/beta hydrolase domain-containing protein [Acidimicrobiales bacterium]
MGVVLTLAATGCGDDDGADPSDSSAPSTPASASPSTSPTTPTGSAPADLRPTGPAATMTEELTGGDGVFIGAAVALDPAAGYEEREYVAEGTASAYTAVGELTPDGQWTLTAGDSADYRTRVLVRRPAAEDFSGTVLVEWLNVSGGVDADPDFATLREEIVRQGHAWIGVSAQLIGVEGGPVLVTVGEEGEGVAGMGLRALDPERYDSLHHPGDAFAFDIFIQVARAVREGGPAIGELVPSQVIAVGESQSAAALVTYINGVQPLTDTFDGFFVHSRGGGFLPLPAAGQSADMTSTLGSTTTLRTDLGVPVMDFQTENDVVGLLNSVVARQPDSDTFRLWETVGTAHADLRLVGETTASSLDCGVPINNGPQHVIAKAALRHLVQWVEGGDPPPMAERLTLDDSGAQARDDDGIALGGVRTPPVDVPAEVLSGVAGPNPAVICILLGSTSPLSATQMAARYTSLEDYEAQYAAAVDAAIDAGFVLEEDRSAIEAYARPELVANAFAS